MRITIDKDSKSPLEFMSTLIKGIFYCRRLPKKIRKTTKGFHFIWSGLDIDFNKSILLRRKIGDDQ